MVSDPEGNQVRSLLDVIHIDVSVIKEQLKTNAERDADHELRIRLLESETVKKTEFATFKRNLEDLTANVNRSEWIPRIGNSVITAILVAGATFFINR